MFWHENHPLFEEAAESRLAVSELKALLQSDTVSAEHHTLMPPCSVTYERLYASQEGITHFSFQPLRNVRWGGFELYYKVTVT